MGDGALLLCRQLAEGPALLRHQEHRVVAKSRRPHGGKGDGTIRNKRLDRAAEKEETV